VVAPALKTSARLADAKEFKAGDVAAGREYVKAYVEFIHYVERLYEASTTATVTSMKPRRLHTVAEKSGLGDGLLQVVASPSGHAHSPDESGESRI
jgi:hypothetical protein